REHVQFVEVQAAATARGHGGVDPLGPASFSGVLTLDERVDVAQTDRAVFTSYVRQQRQHGVTPEAAIEPEVGGASRSSDERCVLRQVPGMTAHRRPRRWG